MAATAVSPASSPRLPSPPPIAEDQLGPLSPIAKEEQQNLLSSVDHGAARRIRPGTKAADMAEGPPLVELSDINSAFQLTEHLKALHNFLRHPDPHTTIPVDREMAYKLAQTPDGVDNTLWLYELCRFLTQKINTIIVALFADSPPCSANTCPEMRASEWQYLCAVHDPPKSCCAIDYCCHTLDWAANTLTSPKHFPSRLAVGTEPATATAQNRQLTNIFRRVYRIFAHAWFQHREMFWKVEGRSGLYVFFKTVCDVNGLIPEDNYTIPPEAEGIETTPVEAGNIPSILKREPSGPGPHEADNTSMIEGITDHTLSTAGTTKRHRHSPSVGATSVTTVVEENEEEEEQSKEEPKEEYSHEDAPTSIQEPAISGEIAPEAEQSQEAASANEPSAPIEAEEPEKQSNAAPEKAQEAEADESEASAVPSETTPDVKHDTDPADEDKEASASSEPEKAEKAEKEEAPGEQPPADDPDSAGEKPANEGA